MDAQFRVMLANAAGGPESKTTLLHPVCQVAAPGVKLLCMIAGLFYV